MNWLRVHIELEDSEPAPVEQALLELGAVSIELSDAADDPILEPAPGSTPLWPTLRINALFDDTIDGTALRPALAGTTTVDPQPSLRFEQIHYEDVLQNRLH